MWKRNPSTNLATARPAEKPRATEPKSVTVLIKPPSDPRPFSVSILTPSDAHQGPGALCHITADFMLLAARAPIDLDTAVVIELPLECLKAGARKALTGGVCACKPLSGDGTGSTWLLTCRLQPPLDAEELAVMQRFIPSLPRTPT